MPSFLISSTSEDLVEHRKRLIQSLTRLQQDAVGMEFFGATARTPVDECIGRVDAADLVVLVVAHRYGWVPTEQEGGDGRTSITRMEFRRAKSPPNGRAPKPVLAFVVDEKAEWTGGREQDRLVTASSPEEALQVYASTRELREFKKEVSTLVRDTFTTPADLADKVCTAVFNWLVSRQSQAARTALAEQALHELMEKVSELLARAEPELAITYLQQGFEQAPPENKAAIADRRFELAAEHLSLYDPRLLGAANAVIAVEGRQRARAIVWLGKCKSQLARVAWKSNERGRAWALAGEARDHLLTATKADPLDPDAFGTLGGVLKRMADWAPALYPEQTRAFEDAMLDAYRSGWQNVPDAYPLLNYIEQRAILAERRSPVPQGRFLIEEHEGDLRIALGRALKARHAQLGIPKERHWAAFDLARGYHYLEPSVPGFLEDLEKAVEEARTIARIPEDRYVVTTTIDSLRSLQMAHVKLDGLAEGIELLELAVQGDDWFIGRSNRPAPYLQKELQALRTLISEAADRQTRLTIAYGAETSRFIQSTQLRWSREEEEAFLKQWRRDLEPRELKFLRGVWKVFGAKSLEVLTGGFIEWGEAAAVAAGIVAKYGPRRE
jgi:hypothetical protein